jgi:hypothetical protein
MCGVLGGRLVAGGRIIADGGRRGTLRAVVPRGAAVGRRKLKSGGCRSESVAIPGAQSECVAPRSLALAKSFRTTSTRPLLRAYAQPAEHLLREFFCLLTHRHLSSTMGWLPYLVFKSLNGHRVPFVLHGSRDLRVRRRTGWLGGARTAGARGGGALGGSPKRTFSSQGQDAAATRPQTCVLQRA